MMNNHELKILIVAPNVSSRFGGEAFLPLKYFQILKKRNYPVRLIAHSRNRVDLENLFGSKNETIHYIEDSVYHRAIWQMGRRIPKPFRTVLFGTALNLLNEAFQTRIIKRLVCEGLVDVIHQPIPVSPKIPSSLYGFGVPVVIGPMNGGMSYPPGYHDFENNITRLFISLARQGAVLLNRIIPGKIQAAVLLVANERTRDALPVKGHPNVIEVVENGVDLSVWNPFAGTPNRPTREEFRLLFMGRLIALKAVDITLETLRLARIKGANVTLDILGDGEERQRLEEMTRSLGLEKVVRFLGFRSQAECASILQEADALILNSLRECGGAVVLEAMSMGKPVIASDWGGPADYIDASCGVLVSPSPRTDFAARLAEAVLNLTQGPVTQWKMGNAGRQKIISKFDWEKKVDRILEIYQEAMTKT